MKRLYSGGYPQKSEVKLDSMRIKSGEPVYTRTDDYEVDTQRCVTMGDGRATMGQRSSLLNTN